jgi:hypothetical protein
VTKFVITVIERITLERLVGTYTEDQPEVEVVKVAMAGTEVEVVDWGAVDQDINRHMLPA